MTCPMISSKRHEPYSCEKSRCAWWIGDSERGDCAVKAFAMQNMDNDNLVEAVDNLTKSVDGLKYRL